MDYITLVSDSSSDIFPDNRISHFRVKLPKKIPLTRFDNQIGLKYISWPHKANNIEDGEFSIYFINVYGSENEQNLPEYTYHTQIDPGYYARPIDLINTLNKKIEYIREEFRERWQYGNMKCGRQEYIFRLW